MKIVLILIFAVATLACPTAHASIGARRAQFWPTLQATRDLDELYTVVGRVQPRFDLETYERPNNQLQTEAHFGRRIWGLQLWGGWIMNSVAPLKTTGLAEHRAFQQTTKSLVFGDFELFARFRLEERFFNHRSGLAWRVREFLRGTLALDSASQWSARMYFEALINLNTTEVVRGKGFDQMRLYLGLVHPLTKTAVLEVGYLNQMLGFAAAPQVTLVHVPYLGLNLTF